jgi:hypothetical protein
VHREHDRQGHAPHQPGPAHHGPVHRK